VTSTSTRSPNWRTDCEIYLPFSGSFAVADVTTAEQMEFVKRVGERFNYRVSMAAKTAILHREYCECACHGAVERMMHIIPCCVPAACAPRNGISYVWIEEHLARCQICRDSAQTKQWLG
jgi:hypothetical protein